MGHYSDLSLDDGPRFEDLETFVCRNCVIDPMLALSVEENLRANKCSYCGEYSNEPIASPFYPVMHHIYEAIQTIYADADQLALPSVDGEYITHSENVDDVVGSVDPGWGTKFLQDVIKSLDSDTYWVEHTNGSWGVSNLADTLRYSWDDFKNQILTKTRYLFLSEPVDEFSIDRPDYIPIASMLDVLSKVLIEEGLVRTISAGTLSYRVRVPKPNEEVTTFSDIGVPPAEKTNGGRLNPTGIPYFYLAMEVETAEAEALTWSHRRDSWYTATFRSKESFKVVDFSSLPEIPSVFDIGSYKALHNRSFLRSLCFDLRKPVDKSGGNRGHIEYVPTQIISEFLRFRFKDAENSNILGVILPSSKINSGVNLTIFSSCNKELEEKWFDLVSIQKYESNL